MHMSSPCRQQRTTTAARLGHNICRGPINPATKGNQVMLLSSSNSNQRVQQQGRCQLLQARSQPAATAALVDNRFLLLPSAHNDFDPTAALACARAPQMYVCCVVPTMCPLVESSASRHAFSELEATCVLYWATGSPLLLHGVTPSRGKVPKSSTPC